MGTSSNSKWTGTKRSLNNGLLLQGRKKKIILLLKSTEEQMRLRSKNLLSKLRNLRSKLRGKQVSLNRKLLKPKLLKLSWTKLLKSLRDCTQRDINFTFNGKRLLRTQEREMSSLMRLVRIMLVPRTILTRRKLTWRIIKTSSKERKITISTSMGKLPHKKEHSLNLGSHLPSLISRERILKEKLQSLGTNFQHSRLSFRTRELM